MTYTRRSVEVRRTVGDRRPSRLLLGFVICLTLAVAVLLLLAATAHAAGDPADTTGPNAPARCTVVEFNGRTVTVVQQPETSARTVTVVPQPKASGPDWVLMILWLGGITIGLWLLVQKGPADQRLF